MGKTMFDGFVIFVLVIYLICNVGYIIKILKEDAPDEADQKRREHKDDVVV